MDGNKEELTGQLLRQTNWLNAEYEISKCDRDCDEDGEKAFHSTIQRFTTRKTNSASSHSVTLLLLVLLPHRSTFTCAMFLFLASTGAQAGAR
jgi:hypothetical protein